MLFNKGLLALAATAALGVSAQDAVAPADSAVVKLEQDNFQDFLKENSLVMAEFFAPWCGHCKKLAPEYVKAAEELKSKNVSLVQIDCDDNRDLCMQLQIPGFPSIKLIKDGDIAHAKDYNGARTAEAIVKFMIKQTQPAVQVVEDKAALDALVANSTVPVVVDFGVNDFNATFYQFAHALSDDYVFISLPSKENKISVFLPVEGSSAEEIVFKGDHKTLAKDRSVFEEWLKVESLPFFGEINGEVFNAYLESGLPLAYFFFNEPSEVEENRKFFTDLAKKYRGKMAFVSLDAKQFGRHAENLNMKQQFPLFAIHNMISNQKFGLPQMAEEEFAKLNKAIKLKTKDITKLVENVLSGKAEAIVKSEEVPSVQESNVFKIVGKTHDKIVADPKKDVLVKYYAPWCGHCKKMAPTYEELADTYASDSSSKDKVVIAEVDATANDIFNVEIAGYPTILLYPAGKNAEPVVYEGDRSLDSFLTFIKENGANGIDGSSLHKKFLETKKAAEQAEIEDDNEDEDGFDDEL